MYELDKEPTNIVHFLALTNELEINEIVRDLVKLEKQVEIQQKDTTESKRAITHNHAKQKKLREKHDHA